MHDAHGRTINYARISITDRCNLRCRYCMPEEGIVKKSHPEILTYAEILRITRTLTHLGITRLKVTGGEPLVRKAVPSLIADLKTLPGIENVTLTTNGILLPAAAKDLHAAGLDAVNVSLDTLDPSAYHALTRGGDVRQALAGLDAAMGVIPRVKVNSVPMSGFGDDVSALAELARDREVHVRFIDVMPMGEGAGFHPVGGVRIREILSSRFGRMERVSEGLGNGPAEYYSLPGFKGRIGFIETLGHGACSRCNRIRLTADGFLKTCLHMDSGVNLRPLLGDGDRLRSVIEEIVSRKPASHCFGEKPGDARGMSEIGG